MIEIIQADVKRCTCDLCRHVWDTLSKTNPEKCPNCRSREWNGQKRTGRPPENREALTLPAPPRLRQEAL